MLDKKGQQLQILSKVVCTISDGLFDSLDPLLENATTVLALVDEILPEGNKVKCIPIEKGLPFIIDADRVEIVEPLIAQLIDCVTDEDVQKIIDAAFERLRLAKPEKKTRTSSGTKATTKENLAAGLEME